MITPEVQARGREFASFWSALMSNQPRYALDFSWPSVGTVQLILSPLLGKPEHSPEDHNLILGASAYLGTIAHTCWMLFEPDLEISLRELPGDPRSIVISVKGGAELPDKSEFSVPISETVGTLFREPPAAFHCFGSFTATEQNHANLLPLFMLGLSTGLCPAGTGRWKEASEQDAKKRIVAADLRHARSCAEFYQNTFPAEPIGADPELFFGGLVFPPAGHKEDFIGARAAHRLEAYLRSKSYPEDEVRSLLFNLAQFPDRQIAEAAYCVMVARQKADPSERQLAISDSLGERKVKLKPAIAIARRAADEAHSAPGLLEQGKVDEAERMVELERALGLLPLFRIPFKDALAVPALFHRLYWHQPEEAVATIEEHTKEKPVVPAFALLRLVLLTSLGRLDVVEAELQNRTENSYLAKLDSPILRSMRDDLVAAIALSKGDLPLAESIIGRSLEAGGMDSIGAAEMLRFRGECLLAMGRPQDALASFEEAVREYPAFIARMRVLLLQQQLGIEIDLEAELEKLSRTGARRSEVYWQLVTLRTGKLAAE